jgi:polyisoprenoid-binding protein YceI
MKFWKTAAVCLAAVASVTGLFLANNSAGEATGAAVLNSPAATMRYELDPGRSTFMVHAFRGGPVWFKGHDHYIAARSFMGVAELTPGALNPASLQMTVRADSLEETGANFTPQQKGIIKKELQEIVLETAKYPDITFRSTDVTGELKNGQFDVNLGGDMTLHGVTRHIKIPATVTLEGDILRAKGEFKLDRGDFHVKATSAFHGMVRVKDSLKFTFNIVGRKI